MDFDEIKQQFLVSLDSPARLLALFDLLPDVSFFMKDRAGRFIALNRRGCEYCGVRNEREAMQRTDRDFFPGARAEEYMNDDRAVMESGIPMLDRVEPAPEMEGSPRLVITNKIPLRNRAGEVIGVAGFSREVSRVGGRQSIAGLTRAVEHLHEHAAEPISTKRLAGLAGLSESQFERTFRRTFHASPRQYLLRIRVETACRALAATDETVAAVAVQCGFYDHAHFIRSFRRIMGCSPTEYRRNNGAPAAHR